MGVGGHNSLCLVTSLGLGGCFGGGHLSKYKFTGAGFSPEVKFL